jgi:hypothetical protein
MPDLAALHGLRWERAGWLPVDCPALYMRPPPRIALNAAWWAEHGRCAKRAVLANEAGHHLGRFTHRLPVPREERRRLEGKADRVGGRWLIPDAEVALALAEGLTEPWEWAERWQVPPAFAQRRVQWFLQDHPGADL